MNKPDFCRNFFLKDWRHKRLKNKIDLLLFYKEHFYGFSESGIESSKYHPGREGGSGQIFPSKASEKLWPLEFIFMPGEF